MNKAIGYLKKLSLGVALALLTISTSISDDIDVYVAPPDSATPGDTFVVFTLDLRPNVVSSSVCTGTDENGDNECLDLFTDVYGETYAQEALSGHTSFLELLTAALRKVLGALNSDKINVALMVPHADGGGKVKDNTCLGFQGKNVKPGCSNGAYVLSAFKTTSDATEMDQFFESLESIPLKEDDNWNGHPYQHKELFFEMYRYVTAGAIHNSENGTEDFKTNDTYNIDDPEDTESVNPDHNEDISAGQNLIAELKWDDEAVEPNNKVYRNSLDVADHCSSIFSVNLTDGTANSDGDSDSYIEMDRSNGGLGIDLSNSNLRSREEVLEFLANTDLDDSLVGTQNIISYFIAKESGGSGDVGGRANDWADAGGTGSALLATNDPDDLVNLLAGLFNEILGVSTTFVAASVPANVFNRAETLNEVFLAIFEPDENNDPFWTGNVKKLTTTTIEETVLRDTDGDGIDETVTEDRKILVDVLEAGKDNPNSAINPLDGRIRSGALTYWTRTGTDDEYLPAPATEDDEQEFQQGTDGRKVDRGGSGQVKPGYLSNSPGETNDASSNTTLSGPRKILTEADNDDNVATGMVNLNADSNFDTAINLLSDGRPFPGGDGTLSYGAHLYQTVMSDCSDCASSYVDETNSNYQDTAESRVNNLIRFARGYNFTDIDTPTPDDNQSDENESIRSWWQSDPLHTRPLALNYGARGSYSETDPDIRVIVAGNDGHVQMIRDGRKPSDGSEDGVEAWSFLPREFVPLQKRLLEGTVGTYDPGQPYDPPHLPMHPYSMDGAPTALIIDNNRDGTIDTAEGDQAYIFLGQRRGGKRYYSLDVSDPDDPKFLWSIGKDDTGGDFEEMGQSWSLMRAGIMQVEEGTTTKRRPVLVFSGGYNGDDGGDGAGDLGKDSRVKNHDSGSEILGTNDHEGNALFIVNALTGDLIWKVVGPSSSTDSIGTNFYDSSSLALEHAGLVDSVAASPTIVDGDGDGFLDRVYFPDTGGNVWRVDAAGPDRSTWEVNKLFAGGRHVAGQADDDHDRRFFNAPDVVFASDADGDFDAVILASGDRAHPLGTEVENWLYMIKDRNTTSGNPPTSVLTNNDLADLTDNCLQDESVSCSGSVTDNFGNGWKVQLQQCEAGGTGNKCGEKALASPLTIEGTIFLTTYMPVIESSDSIPTTCGPKEGGGLFYALDLQNAGAVLDLNPADDSGGVDSPERFERLASPGIPPEVVAISPNEVLRPDLQIEKTSGRESSDTFWYQRRFQ